MKIKLTPISHPKLDTIEIDNDAFIIGRLEEPFISFDSEITADLSRRHAKVFTENGQVCIVDLESLNGTTLNDLKLGTKPLPVNDGDIVEFAGHLAFKIEFAIPDQEETRLASPFQGKSLTLEPVDKSSGLDILVITGFPFLISKEAGVFASLHKDFELESSRISRRHAYILQENNELKLVDMTSTNGTFYNSKQIDDEQPVTLNDGDIVSFAGDFFTYIVKLGTENQSDTGATVLRPEDNEIEEEHTSAYHNNQGFVEPKTTFVNEPSPFLDILCNEVINTPGAEKGFPTDTTKNYPQKKNSFVVSFIQQCWSALADENPKKTSKKTYLIFFSILCIAAGTIYLYLNDDTREIKKLIYSGQYSNAAAISIEKLESDPDNAVLLDLHNTAVLNTVIPDWLEKQQKNQYTEAEQSLQNTKKAYLTNPEIVRSIDILLWAANLHQFMSSKDRNEAIVIFKDENEINTLLQFWENNHKQNRQTLSMIARRVSPFKPYYEQTLSDIRSLENDRDLYLNAMDKLKSKLLGLLKKGEIDELSLAITDFENQYTAITGMDNLKLDIYNYIEINEAIANKDIESLAKLEKRHVFKTPLFNKYSKQTFKDKLPSEQFTQQYAEAINSWQSGEIEIAINLLLSLSEGNWRSWSQNKLDRYQTILNEYSELKQAKESEKYVESLFNFHTLLNHPEDKYFLKAIESDFQDNKQIALSKARENFDQAKTYWEKYQNNNGIGGLLRLENHVSKTYKAQAGNITAAYQYIHYSLHIFEDLHLNAPDDIKQLSMTIGNELKNQRTWLTDLELILKPEILKTKLDLLATPRINRE